MIRGRGVCIVFNEDFQLFLNDRTLPIRA